MKKELSFSEILQKNIDKHNKKHQEELKYIQEIKARQKLNESQDEPPLNDNQINIMDMIK